MSGNDIGSFTAGIAAGIALAIVLHFFFQCHQYTDGYIAGKNTCNVTTREMTIGQIKALHPDLEDVVLIKEEDND